MLQALIFQVLAFFIRAVVAAPVSCKLPGLRLSTIYTIVIEGDRVWLFDHHNLQQTGLRPTLPTAVVQAME